MKILTIIFSSIIFVFSSQLYAQWLPVQFPGSVINTLYNRENNLILPVTNAGYYGTRFFLTNDNGETWDSIGTLQSYIYEVQRLDNFIFASTNWPCSMICSFGPSIFRTNLSNPIIWDTLYNNEGGVYNLISHKDFIYFKDGIQFFKSTDYGTTWVPIQFQQTNNERLVSINNILYNSNLYLSNDNGNTWDSFKGDLPISTVIGIQKNSSFLFVFTTDSIFRSDNNGTNWQVIDKGLPENPNLWNLTVSDNWIAASNSLKVFISKNNGDQWLDISEGLNLHGYGYVMGLAINSNYLFAATDEGLWRYDLSILDNIDRNRNDEEIRKFTLEQNYPNPFNPSTTISFNLPSKSFVSLKICDLIGREVATVVSEELNACSYNRQWNASGFASGIYFYRIQAGSFSETKKLLLLR